MVVGLYCILKHNKLFINKIGNVNELIFVLKKKSKSDLPDALFS